MSLFLVLSIPLWLIFVVSLYPRPARSWRGLLIPLLGGLVLGMATLTLTLGLLTRTPFGVDFGLMYTWAWYRGPGWSMTVAAVVMAAFNIRKPTAYSRIRILSLVLGGAAFVYLLWQALTPDPGFEAYRVLYTPFLWISTVGMVSWILDRGLRLDGWLSYALIVIAVAIPSITTFLPVLYNYGYEFAAWIIAPLPVIGTGILFLLDSRGRLS